MPYRRYSVVDPRRHYIRATSELGRRGTILVLLGVVWIFQGVAIVLTTTPSTYELLSGYDEIRAAAWFLTGTLAIVFSRVPQGFDAVGFVSLYIMAAYRIFAYTFSFALWALPSEGGNPRGIIGTLSWTTILIMFVVVAGWRENEDGGTANVRIPK